MQFCVTKMAILIFFRQNTIKAKEMYDYSNFSDSVKN